MHPASATPAEIIHHMGFVRRVARGLVLDPHVAEDLSQSAIVAALEQRPNPRLGIQAWLTGVIRNLARVHYRKEGRGRRQDFESVATEGAVESISAQLSVAETVERGELSEILVRTVMEMEEPYRTVLLGRYLDEKSPPELAVMLERPLETVRTQLRRGLAKMRTALDTRHRGRREDWLAALIPLVGEEAMRAVLVTGAPAAAGAGRALVGTWRLIGLVGVLVGSLLTLRLVVFQKPELSRGELALIEDSEILTEPSVMSMGEAPARAAALPPAATTPSGTAAPLSISPRNEQAIRVLDRATGRPVFGARITSFAFAANSPEGEASGEREPIRELKDESAFDFSHHARGSSARSSGYSIRLGSGMTDAAGAATLWVTPGGATRVVIEADGYARGYHEILSQRDDVQLTIDLERAAGLEVRRGEAPVNERVTFILSNTILGVEHRDVLYPGELRSVLTELPPALYDLRVDLGPQRREGRTVRLEEGARTTIDLWRRGQSALSVKLMGSDALPAGAKPHLTILAPDRAESFVVPVSSSSEVRVPGLPLGPVKVELRVDRVVVARAEVVLERPSHALSIALPPSKLEVSYVSDSPRSPYWSALLYGPLEAAANIRGLRTQELERNDAGAGTLFSHLAPGDYELWVVEDFEAYREIVTVAPLGSSVTVERNPSLSGILELLPEVSGARSEQIEILTMGGLHLPFPYLSTGSTAVLPVGAYEFYVGSPNSSIAPLQAEVLPGRSSLVVPSALPARQIRLTAFEEASGVALEALLIERSRRIWSEPREPRLLRLKSGVAQLTLAMGSYRAIDAHGREIAVEVTKTTSEVDLRYPELGSLSE